METAGVSAGSQGPGRVWYLVAIVVAVAGLVAGGILVWRTIATTGADLERVVVPGELDLVLEDSGTHTIYYEYRSVIDGRIFATGDEDVSDLRVAVESLDTGQELDLRPPAGDFEYEFGGRSGHAVLNFDVTAPGAHRLSAWYPEGMSGPDVVLAVGRGVGRALAIGVFAGIAVAFGAFGLALVVALVTFVKRKQRSSSGPAADASG